MRQKGVRSREPRISVPAGKSLALINCTLLDILRQDGEEYVIVRFKDDKLLLEPIGRVTEPRILGVYKLNAHVGGPGGDSGALISLGPLMRGLGINRYDRGIRYLTGKWNDVLGNFEIDLTIEVEPRVLAMLRQNCLRIGSSLQTKQGMWGIAGKGVRKYATKVSNR
jgi:hypothetical protein